MKPRAFWHLPDWSKAVVRQHLGIPAKRVFLVPIYFEMPYYMKFILRNVFPNRQFQKWEVAKAGRHCCQGISTYVVHTNLWHLHLPIENNTIYGSTLLTNVLAAECLSTLTFLDSIFVRPINLFNICNFDAPKD